MSVQIQFSFNFMWTHKDIILHAEMEWVGESIRTGVIQIWIDFHNINMHILKPGIIRGSLLKQCLIMWSKWVDYSLLTGSMGCSMCTHWLNFFFYNDSNLFLPNIFLDISNKNNSKFTHSILQFSNMDENNYNFKMSVYWKYKFN